MNSFSYFSAIHIQSLILSIIIIVILLLAPKIFNFNIYTFAKIIGFTIIISKILETLQRYLQESFTLPSLVPLHLCNVSMIISAFMLMFHSEKLFNIAYFWGIGALLAVILPGINNYYNNLFVYFFIVNHSFVLFAILYGFIYFKFKPNFKGFILSSILIAIFSIISLVYNNIFDLNFFFMNNYVHPMFSFIKPFNLYRVTFVVALTLVFYLMYLPFKKYNQS